MTVSSRDLLALNSNAFAFTVRPYLESSLRICRLE